MLIFIGMETSGALRRRFQSRGHETYSCDILPSEDGGEEMAFSADGLPLGRHLVGDVFETLENMKACDLWPDMAVFHPTCTYLTNSAAWAFKDPDYDKYPGIGYHQKIKPGTLTGKARRDARDAQVEQVKRLWKLPIKRKVVENPIGALSKLWRKPTQIIQPYQFGDDASKATCYWLDGLLPLKPTEFCKPRMYCPMCERCSSYYASFKYGCVHCFDGEPALLRPRWANQTDSGQNRLSPGDDRWKDRSRSYPGPSDAMAQQWTDDLTAELEPA